ncbi:hypothetical protein EJ05DRAFT_533717 [Pseudovirgaria hyperparasitica]|uniref:Mitochondrial integral membrane protein-like protein n=1 Tax=Pseudovirgaria hyperparasitica TaxID=470096 RepID=A0A6A6VVH0_9PEZI|nr:uncharacterized protein EJ05DRAFT_533717 [Pseudovirgaria hyperparasitica]KAF2753257.1 hypothetical protein EJ05DRAFT_533717 [Pseudovirgaria hyperparasitica]
MVSLWSSKQNGDGVDGQADERTGEEAPPPRSSGDYRSPEADERTRLLPAQPRPPPNDGYLDPDDPAVSPYNLWSVRFLRWLTVLFFLVTFVWWVLLLVSIFVSPPGMHSRGSGFFDFSYTTLTLGNLFVALLFYTNPSRAMRISSAIIATLLLIDVILISAVTKVRFEEGWVGLASVIWATIMAIWCLFVDRIVAWGKREEEERLTGRPETRRTLAEWIGVFLATVILIIYIVIVILMTGTLILRARDASLPMAGERYFVDGDKYQVHLACVGNVTESHGKREPTVLLEAGEYPSEYDFEHWAYNSYRNGSISRYCYWDRPGYAWSDNAPSPHSAGMSSDALSEALARAGEEGPWIAVGAGVGTITSRIFAARHPHDVVGIMLIDPYHEDLLHRLSSPGRGFVLWGWGVLSPLGIERLGGAMFKGRTRQDRVYGRNAYQSGKFIKAQLQENLVADSLSKNEVVSARAIQSQSVPVVVVSSGIKVKTDSEWEKKQEDLSKLTKNLVAWDSVKKAPHQVWKTYDGRQTMEKDLKLLVAAAAKVKTG